MKIKDVNNLIKKIKNYYDNKLNFHEIQIKNNIVQNLLNKISDFTQNLKNNQEIYLKKFQELNSSELKNKDNNDILIEDNNNNNINSNTNQFFNQKQIKKNTLIKERNKELNSLLKNFYEITDIFKDAQKLVVEQGTILDRIDYNIDCAAVKVNEGKKNLEKTEEIMKKSCYRKVMFTMLIIIFVEIVLILLKFL
jgi:syntaxin 16